MMEDASHRMTTNALLRKVSLQGVVFPELTRWGRRELSGTLFAGVHVQGSSVDLDNFERPFTPPVLVHNDTVRVSTEPTA